MSLFFYINECNLLFLYATNNSNAIVQDDEDDAEDQQRFSNHKAHNKANESAS